MTGVIDPFSAMRRFLTIVDDNLPEPQAKAAQAVLDRADQRLALSMNHTVVALAGATGSGKSSIFNAIAGCDLSPVSVCRPTTSVAHACFWGSSEVDPLLDWLAVAPNRRFNRSRASSRHFSHNPEFEGLVILDLPDFDSVDEAHHAEVQRLLDLVDQVVWVLDPQKYADKTLHDQYLRASAPYREVTVVVLNQTDTLSGADSLRCVDDLRHLLDSDGLIGVPILTTSTVEPGGLASLFASLDKCVSARDIPQRRLTCAVAEAMSQLSPLVAADVTEARLDRTAVRPVIEALSAAAGVPAIIDSVEPAYLQRAKSSTGWPIARLIRKVSPDPRRRLGVDRGELGDDPSTTPVSSPETAAGQRAAGAMAARELAAYATESLPEPWPTLAQTAALEHEPNIPRALEEAIGRVVVAFGKRPAWWTGVQVAHGIAAALAAASLAWLVIALIVSGSGSVTLPAVGLAIGALVGVILSAVTRPLVQLSARRAKAKAELRLRVAIAEVASDLIVAPVRGVLRTYVNARTALRGE